MELTADKLQAAICCGRGIALTFAGYLSAACEEYGIVGQKRLPRFLAQVGHESAGLSRTVENLNYSAQGLIRTWPSRFDAATAAAYARQPERIANRAYADRMGNGSESSGDGWKYRGRGLLQITGRANYSAITELLRHKTGAPDFVREPWALAEPRWAVYSAAALWRDWGLNELADAGDDRRITKRINGGLNGWEDRIERLRRAQRVLGGSHD